MIAALLWFGRTTPLPQLVTILAWASVAGSALQFAVQVPVVVTSEIQAAKIIKRVIPQYPPLAKQTRVQGTVRLTGIIAKDGTIQQLQLLSGHPLLAPVAMEAVRQWVYRPTILNGQPVEVIAPIDVTFTLQR